MKMTEERNKKESEDEREELKRKADGEEERGAWSEE